ncbi:MAG TPA: hypothetical protein VJN96_04845 [Vicinamibacterales bacterium]|nr:hypothetical protein [Vicinamibacterales bacterium]
MIRSRPDSAAVWSILIRVATRILIAAYLIEAGLLLTVAPWMSLWRRNAFLSVWPWLGPVMGNPYVRGAVTGIGIITLAAGFRDLGSVFLARVAGPGPDGRSRMP